MKRHDEYRHLSVGDMTDAQLLADRGQIRVSIKCGVAHDHEKRLAARELEINRELAKRASDNEAAGRPRSRAIERANIQRALEEVLRERGLVFARLEPNGQGGSEWAPLYRGQTDSNAVIEALVASVLTELGQ